MKRKSVDELPTQEINLPTQRIDLAELRQDIRTVQSWCSYYSRWRDHLLVSVSVNSALGDIARNILDHDDSEDLHGQDSPYNLLLMLLPIYSLVPTLVMNILDNERFCMPSMRMMGYVLDPTDERVEEFYWYERRGSAEGIDYDSPAIELEPHLYRALQLHPRISSTEFGESMHYLLPFRFWANEMKMEMKKHNALSFKGILWTSPQYRTVKHCETDEPPSFHTLEGPQ